MGLDFTSIKDTEGLACYILHTGDVTDVREFEVLKRELEHDLKAQVVLIDVHSTDGEKIRTFYSIEHHKLPAMLVVRDDDTLAKIWYSTEIPSIDHLAHELRQYGA